MLACPKVLKELAPPQLYVEVVVLPEKVAVA
jgi:hypothetical protein